MKTELFCESAKIVLQNLRKPLSVTNDDGQINISEEINSDVVGLLPALPPENLGGPGFKRQHNTRYAYCAGAMANGISSEELVIALGNAGMMGSFGAAGLPPNRVEQAIDKI